MTDAVKHPPSPSQWDVEFERLRARFPDAKASVLLCVHALQQRPDIDMAGLKAQADLHGVKVSIGSWNAARQLLMPPKPKAQPDSSPTSPGPASLAAIDLAAPADQSVDRSSDPSALAVSQPAPHAAAASKTIAIEDAAGPVERMARMVVTEIQAAGEAQAERLRIAIREALAVIAAALADEADAP